MSPSGDGTLVSTYEWRQYVSPKRWYLPTNGDSMFLRNVGIYLRMETVCFSETLISTYESTRRHNPEDEHCQSSCCTHT
jgi:hypothetical protein